MLLSNLAVIPDAAKPEERSMPSLWRVRGIELVNQDFARSIKAGFESVDIHEKRLFAIQM